MRIETARDGPVRGSAMFDDRGVYRYRLSRRWNDHLPTVTWCMLNPSTADALDVDPTIRRVIGFSRAWGFGGFDVVNLFALRTPDSSELAEATDPVGPENDRVMAEALVQADRVVVAWGNGGLVRSPGSASPRWAEVGEILDGEPTTVWCLGSTRKDQPRHPLYLRRDTPRRLWDFRP